MLVCLACEPEEGREPTPECDCCRCTARRVVPVSVSIICCCGGGEDGPGSGGGGGSGQGGTGGTSGTGGTGTGTISGPGWYPGEPVWGPPDGRGWQVWGEPFTLPVTCANWPARYSGALDPGTHSDPVLLARDVLECGERLDGLSLLAGMSPATMQQHFTTLRGECVRLVQDWPGTPNYAVGLLDSADGASAPQLSLRLVSQLQMAALSPYMARVLGLYFVDTHASPGQVYDYLVGRRLAGDCPASCAQPGQRASGRGRARQCAVRRHEHRRRPRR